MRTTWSCRRASADKLSAILLLLQDILTPETNAMAYDTGYFYPGPSVKGATLDKAPQDSQDVIKKFGRDWYDDADRVGAQGDPAHAGAAGEGVRHLGPRSRCRKVHGEVMALTASAFDSLELKDVGRRFGGRDALVGLNLTIRAGEFIALLGPSGCGKSTALNCLAGLLPLTDGSIWLDGKRIDILPPEKRDFGMVFQNYALFPHMTVRKNVGFGLQVRGTPWAEITTRVAEAIALVQLEEHAKQLPGQLSGGQQQRVAIARAIVLEPPLVLMDEPLSNLDAKLRLEMRTEIRRIHQSLGLTTIYVTHDQDEALSLADRLVVLRDGRVQQIGTPQELHDNPANWHVADFMGYRNLLDVTVDSVSGSAGSSVRARPVTDRRRRARGARRRHRARRHPAARSHRRRPRTVGSGA